MPDSTLSRRSAALHARLAKYPSGNHKIIPRIKKTVLMEREVATNSTSHCKSRAGIASNEPTMKTAASESPAKRGRGRRSRHRKENASREARKE